MFPYLVNISTVSAECLPGARDTLLSPRAECEASYSYTGMSQRTSHLYAGPIKEQTPQNQSEAPMGFRKSGNPSWAPRRR